MFVCQDNQSVWWNNTKLSASVFVCAYMCMQARVIGNDAANIML